jgi:aryl-alcohol dehydrogenase-like predicted oxidoreductase
VAVIAKVPLDSGWLTGKYDEKSVFSGVRSRWSDDEKAVRSVLVKKVKEIISENTSIKSAALSFCTFYDEISTVISGAISTKQLIDNIKSISNNLDLGIVSELESLYENEIKHLKLPW